MRTALTLSIVLAACASTKEGGKPAPQAAEPPSQTSGGFVAAAPGSPTAAPGGSVRHDQPVAAQQTGPALPQTNTMTASEAAAAYAKSHHGAGGDASRAQARKQAQSGTEDGPCSTDDDCAFTRVGEGECCPMLCTPRVVTKKRAKELEDNVATCNPRGACPDPLCRPPRTHTRPACVQNRCIAAPVATPMEN